MRRAIDERKEEKDCALFFFRNQISKEPGGRPRFVCWKSKVSSVVKRYECGVSNAVTQ